MDISEIKSALTDMNKSIDGRIDDLQKQLKDATEYAESLELKMNRASLGGIGSPRNTEAKVSSALATFARSGDLSEFKSVMMEGSDPDGGYVVVEARSDLMTKRLFDQSPLRRLARIENISTGDAWAEPIDYGDVAADWVGELEARSTGTNPKIGLLTIPVDELCAMQGITQRLLDDSYINLGDWIQGKIADKFARQECAAFVSGDGVKKPKGFMTYPTSVAADASRDWFTIQHIVSGHASTITADALRDIVWSLRAPYRRGAAWLMNSNTANVIDKLKDGQGNYLWRDSSAAGVPPTLLGYPVEFDETIPDVSTNSFPLAFANWKVAYVIVDKIGFKPLIDPYTDKPKVLFYVYKRVGGGLANSEAIKLMKIST